MLDLIHIKDILEWQRKLRLLKPEHMTPDVDESCRLMIEAIAEGRVQIIVKKK